MADHKNALAILGLFAAGSTFLLMGGAGVGSVGEPAVGFAGGAATTGFAVAEAGFAGPVVRPRQSENESPAEEPDALIEVEWYLLDESGRPVVEERLRVDLFGHGAHVRAFVETDVMGCARLLVSGEWSGDCLERAVVRLVRDEGRSADLRSVNAWRVGAQELGGFVLASEIGAK